MAIKELANGVLEITYQGLEFQQNPDSPRLFSFVASADELIKFCGVARKSHDLLTNYQRALDTDRVETEVAPFFRDPRNCSPTAVVISLHNTPARSISLE